MNYTYKVLQVAATDVAVKKFLTPLIDRLSADGYELHIACSEGDYIAGLRAQGYRIHTIPIKRRISPISNFNSLWHLCRLMRKEHFDIVHVHTPVAAALGRIAAWVTRVPVVLYTAHGFYFHENMSSWARRVIIWIEKFLSRFTHLIFTVSNEDAVTAIKENICPADRVVWIGNGIEIGRFTAGPNGTRAKLGLSADDKVIGFVGRIVAEKGILDLVEAMKQVIDSLPEAKLILVGDTLKTDRDKKTKQIINNLLSQDNLASHIVVTGFLEDIPGVMDAIDLFVLPSYREGMPRSIIEAMASGKPVVATDIRGCREEVVPGSSGLLVPIGDPAALARAIITILSNPELAGQMGAEGKRRASELFDERIVLDRQIRAYASIIRKRLPSETSTERALAQKRIQLFFKRLTDTTLSFFSLVILCLPFALVFSLIKTDSRGPGFFRQERAGKDGKVFLIWKFRTMMDGAVNHGLGFNVAKDDPRLTRVGKLLRNWGFDELPQLINVFKGDMSIVGPRPALCYQVERYDDFQRQRLEFKPGITSLAVVSGRNLLSWKERIKLDVLYIHNWSLWLDLKIIVKTFWAVLMTRKGIYGPGGINDDFTVVETRNVNSETLSDRQEHTELNAGPVT